MSKNGPIWIEMLISFLQLFISISFQFFLCTVIHCLIFTLTDTVASTYNFDIEGLNNFYKLYYVKMDSTIDPSDTKEETTIEDKGDVLEEQEGTESTHEKEPEQDELPSPPTKSPSYTLYIATLIAVLGAAASLVQTNCCFNSFVEEFTSGLCAKAAIDNANEGATQALEEAVALHRGLSSIFDPVLKEGEKYDAVSAIKSRYVKTFF